MWWQVGGHGRHAGKSAQVSCRDLPHAARRSAAAPYNRRMNSSPVPKSAGLPIAAVLLVALAAGLGLWAGQRWMGSPAPLKMETVVLYPEPRELPEFQLDGADGTIDASTLRGRWTLLFLGFTHCPDVCPTTLADLSRVQKLMADLPEAQRPRILFVSADPERDSAQATTDYARFFSPDALGATADQARLEPFARSLHGVHESPTPGRRLQSITPRTSHCWIHRRALPA